MSDKPTILKDELAEILGVNPGTIDNLISKEPTRLPPWIQTKKGATCVWLRSTVMKWLEEREKYPDAPQPRRRKSKTDSNPHVVKSSSPEQQQVPAA